MISSILPTFFYAHNLDLKIYEENGKIGISKITLVLRNLRGYCRKEACSKVLAHLTPHVVYKFRRKPAQRYNSASVWANTTDSNAGADHLQEKMGI